MKKLFLFSIILFLCVTNSRAQGADRKFKKFKGEFSLGYSSFPDNADFKNGFLIAFEPKFLVLDQVAIGARIETIILGSKVTNDYYSTVSGDINVKVYESFLATGEYYFTKDFKLRPFAGGGGGIYAVATANSYDENTRTVARFGAMLRAGIEITHFRFGLEYNMVPATNSVKSVYNQTTSTYDNVIIPSKNAYFSIKAGICFGGGLRNR